MTYSDEELASIHHQAREAAVRRGCFPPQADVRAIMAVRAALEGIRVTDSDNRFMGIFIFRDYSGLQERIGGSDLGGVLMEVRDVRCRIRLRDAVEDQQKGQIGVVPIDLSAPDYDKLAAAHRDYLRRLAKNPVYTANGEARRHPN